MATHEHFSLTRPRRGSARECLIYVAALVAGALPCVDPGPFDSHWSLAAGVGLIAMLWATRGLVLNL